MKVILYIDELRHTYSECRPLCDWVSFENVLKKLLLISCTDFSRTQKTEVWELLEDINYDNIDDFNMSCSVNALNMLDINIDMFMEFLYFNINAVTGLDIEDCTIEDATIKNNILILNVTEQNRKHYAYRN